MRPLLSIIVPVYRVEAWLPACIESILKQTFSNYELLLVDDGSPDRSGAICDEYALRDERIRVIHKANAGVSAARNDALDMARGEFITFIDSDDALSSETTLEANIMHFHQMPDVDIVQFPVSGCQKVNPQILSGQQEVLQALNAFTFTGYLWGKIYKASLFAETRLRTDCTFAEDTWCLLELMDQVNKVFLSSDEGYFYNQREDSAVHSFDARKCFDLYRMSEVFHKTLMRYFPVDNPMVISHFFLTYQRLLDARIANKEDLSQASVHLNCLRKMIPPLSVLWQCKLSAKQRLWRLLLAVPGIKVSSWLYVSAVRFRLRFIALNK